jgi:hypothetical protein
VIGGKNEQESIASGGQRRYRGGRSCIASDRFDNEAGRQSDPFKLCLDGLDMLVIADDDRLCRVSKASHPTSGRLDEGFLADQLNELLRFPQSGNRPEAGSGTS